MKWLAKLTVILTAAVLVTGAGVVAGAAPAFAEPALQWAPATEPSPPSPEAQLAAKEVRAYLETHTQPSPPAEPATREVLNAYAFELYAFLSEFPWDAGIRQWDCTPDGHDVDLYPETAERHAYVAGEFSMHCGGNGQGYPPSGDEILQVRPEPHQIDQLPAGGVAAEGCQVIASGQHCVTIEPGVQGAMYVGLGDIIYGRVRIGQASVVWPGCNAGTTRRVGTVREFRHGWSQEVFNYDRQNANWSNAFDQATSGGTITGMRSVYCEAG